MKAAYNTAVINLQVLLGALVSFASFTCLNADELRVLTYNIHHGEGNDGRFDLERIAQLITAQEPDLVALQEIDVKTTRASGVDQAAELARLTKMHYAFGKFMDFRGGEYGQMVLSKYPILFQENLKLPEGPEPRAAMTVKVKLPEWKEIYFVGNHLYATAEQRLAQARVLVKRFAKTKEPVILAGDFNSLPASPPMRLLKESGWLDPTLDEDNPTFPSQDPRKEIDYVLYRPGELFELKESKVIEEPVASDHCPVLTILRVRAQRTSALIEERPVAWASPLSKHGVPNLHQVDDGLYRSAQPSARGMKELKAMGVETIINLRSFNSDRDEIGDTGLGYEHIYMKAWHPERKEVVRFLQIVGNDNRRPVLVHCHHGADRTGTMCAIYRIAVDGWSVEEALEEMKGGGFGFHSVWGNLPRWVASLDIDAIKVEAGWDL